MKKTCEFILSLFFIAFMFSGLGCLKYKGLVDRKLVNIEVECATGIEIEIIHNKIYGGARG